MRGDKKNLFETKTGKLDWNAVKQHLEAASDRGGMLTSEDQKRIFSQRALVMAQEEKSDIEEEKINVVEFLLAHEKYGIETSTVSEVFQIRELMPLPGTPDFIAGIINVRSRIISIIDIKKLFNLPEKGLTNLNKAIIISSEEKEFGILVDEILDVRSLPRNDLQTSVATLTGIREEYLLGITKDRVVILDGHRLLSDSNLVINDRTNRG